MAEVMTKIVKATNAQAFSTGLNPAQWAALRYFAQAPAASRTVSGFAGYHGTTKGTASQTVSALVRKGLVQRSGASRTLRLDLTEAGFEVVRQDPINQVADAIAALPEGDRWKLAEILEHVLRRVVAG